MPEKQRNSFIVDFMLGGFSAAAGKTATAPIQRVKYLLQVQHAHPHIPKDQQFKGIIDCFSRIISEQGFLSLWRGNFPNCLSYIPRQGCNFIFKDIFRNLIVHSDPKKEPVKFLFGNFVSGGAAGVTTMILSYPLNFARVRLAADVGTSENREFKGMIDCYKKVVAQEGFTALYRGFVVAYSGVFLYRGLYFGLYDTGKSTFFKKENGVISMYAFAQAVTITAGFLSYPLSTVTARLMMTSGQKERLYNGTRDCFRKIYRQEGLKGFYRGYLVTFLNSFGSAFALSLYGMINP